MKRDIQYIESIVCAGEKVDPDVLHTRDRHGFIVDARNKIMYLAMNFGNVGREVVAYYGMKHPAENYARREIQKRRCWDRIYDDVMREYEDQIRCDTGEQLSFIQQMIVNLKKDVKKVREQINYLEKTYENN